MKRVLLLFALVAMSAQLHADEVLSQRKINTAKRVARYSLPGVENNVFTTFSTGISSYNGLLAIMRIEYNRAITDRWFWGVSFQNNVSLGRLTTYDWDGSGLSPYRNTLYQDVFIISGMAYYRLPVIDGRLYLRPGAGIGVGMHALRNHIDNTPSLQNKTLPYFSGELCWILRLSKHLEFKLAPTLFLFPQSFAFSPVQLGAPTDVNPLFVEMGATLGLGYRF